MKLRIASALLLGLVTACETPDGGGPDGGGETPLYAISTFVNTGGANQSYLVLTDSVSREQHIDVKEGIELPGASSLAVGAPRGKALFVTGDAAATMTRYDLDASGKLVAGKTVSFQDQGSTGQLAAYSSQYMFVSETKAYYLDARTYKAVIWNPKDMTLTGSIDLSALNRAGFAIQFSGSHAVHVGKELFYGVGWLTADRLGVAPRSAMIVINTETDTATIVEDTRCGWARDGVLGADGLIYVATESFGGAAYDLDDAKAGPPCMIRFNPATKTFDSLLVYLDDVIAPAKPGDIAGMLVPGTGGKAYLRVLDSSLVPSSATTPIQLSTATAWRLWEVTLGNAPTATAVAGAAPTNGRSVLQDVGDAIIVPDYYGDSAKTGLHVMSGDATVKTTVEGQARSVMRLR